MPTWIRGDGCDPCRMDYRSWRRFFLATDNTNNDTYNTQQNEANDAADDSSYDCTNGSKEKESINRKNLIYRSFIVHKNVRKEAHWLQCTAVYFSWVKSCIVFSSVWPNWPLVKVWLSCVLHRIGNTAVGKRQKWEKLRKTTTTLISIHSMHSKETRISLIKKFFPKLLFDNAI